MAGAMVAAILAAWTAGICLVAGGFLLLGWRLGRESAGRAMFEHVAMPEGRSGAYIDETDPWEAAMTDDAQAPRAAGCDFP